MRKGGCLCIWKSTQALPLTPKAPDQVLNIFSLLVYFLGLMLQSRQLSNCSHLKRMSPNVKIPWSRGQPAGTGSLVGTPLHRHLLLTPDCSDRVFDWEGNAQFLEGWFEMYSCCMLGTVSQAGSTPVPPWGSGPAPAAIPCEHTGLRSDGRYKCLCRLSAPFPKAVMTLQFCPVQTLTGIFNMKWNCKLLTTVALPAIFDECTF